MALFGRKKDAEPTDDLEAFEAEIRRLESDAAQSARKVDELEIERKACVVGDDFDGAEALRRLIDREEFSIERAAQILPDLRKRLAVVREELRERNFQALAAEYAPLANEFCEAAERALGLAHAIAGVVGRARSIGAEHRALAELPQPPALAGPDAAIVISSEILARWRVALRGQVGAEARSTQPSVRNSAMTGVYTETAATIARPPAPRRVLEADGRVNRPSARPPLVPNRSPGDGEREVVVLRSGIELNGRRLVSGDHVIVEEAVAVSMARNGSVDIVPAATPADQSIERKDAAQ